MTTRFHNPHQPFHHPDIGVWADNSAGLTREQRRAVRREINAEERQAAKKAKAVLAKKGGAA